MPEVPLVSCPICAVTDTRAVYPGAGGWVERHPLVACRRCGLVFQQRARSLTELGQAQEDAYGQPERRFTGPVEWVLRALRRSRVRSAVRLLPAGGRVLDVGCGRGVFLRMLAERGYRVRGTELSAATAANATHEVPIDTGELKPGRYSEATFDLVSIWHVLEHLREPHQALRACHQALAPGGALLVAVPNFGSVQARLGGPHWFHLDLPRHLFQFTPETLRRLLTSAGFEQVRCRTGQWEMDPFGLAQTLLNRAGLRHNALYDTLRNHPDVKRDLSLPLRAALIALFPLAMALALPASLCFRLAGRGGTLIAVARKAATSAARPTA